MQRLRTSSTTVRSLRPRSFQQKSVFPQTYFTVFSDEPAKKMGIVVSFFAIRRSSSPPNFRNQHAIRLQPLYFGSSPVTHAAHYGAGRQSRVLFSSSPLRFQQKPPQSKTKRRRLMRKQKHILFYEKDAPYYGFTNFSPHPVEYRNAVYPTSEHLFQSFKVRDAFGKQVHLPISSSSSKTSRGSQSTFAHILQGPA